MTHTDEELRKQRAKLVRRVRYAYNKMEEWERKHKQAGEALNIFMLRFPHAIGDK